MGARQENVVSFLAYNLANCKDVQLLNLSSKEIKPNFVQWYKIQEHQALKLAYLYQVNEQSPGQHTLFHAVFIPH